jgi:two-component system CAI-1 autoinducer sensor kinase/phosphatase CqsS
MSLIGDAVRNEAAACGEGSSAKLEKLGARLHTLVRNMNHQIDAQIANARLLRLPRRKEAVSAATVVREAVARYPYRSTRERETLVVTVHADFMFAGSHAVFLQVVDNLIKNALRSLAATKAANEPGDVSIDVARAARRGRIVVADRGVGMDAQLQTRIFEPFFSGDDGTGHGLGLAFCRRAVHGANGSIRVASNPTQGASFTIELPTLG